MEEQHIVKILEIIPRTHNVKTYRFTKPEGFHFEPGQATEVSINQEKWKNEKRPFTFTCLNDWDFLEFTIKSYRGHDGVTNALDSLKPGDELIIRDVWGTIQYKEPGYFLAGGAGITPFIAILRQLKKDNKIVGNELFFSNKTPADIILHNELGDILGDKAHFLVTEIEAHGGNVEHGYIDKSFIQNHIKDYSKPFYLCGPDKMVADLKDILKESGAKAESVVFEK